MRKTQFHIGVSGIPPFPEGTPNRDRRNVGTFQALRDVWGDGP
ncbi:MAG TPA: hypothetical protein VJG90_09330 [Candidatus Nanoarchaeia archaeon]|nr:hypothetical protein [Candidatus Nanoarchaeia archaeon]